jgi:hypothetical protein
MSEWITDRLPTQEEAGRFGFVMIPANNDRSWDSAVASGITLGQPWAPWPKMPPFEPKPEYWSKPSDFPPVCWLWRPHWECCALVTSLYSKGELRGRVVCSGMSPFKVSDLKNARWSDRPFDCFEDGKPCVKGGEA